jgi:hypothetical protein
MMGEVRTAGWVGVRLSYEGERHWLTTAEVTRAPRRLFPHEGPGSAGQQWQAVVRLVYNPF